MSKLYFRYGAMNCGKTTVLLQVAHNYEVKGLKVIVIKSSVDKFLSIEIEKKQTSDTIWQRFCFIFAVLNLKTQVLWLILKEARASLESMFG